MDREVDLGRRGFTLASALALLAGVSVTITGCGGSSDAGAGPSDTGNGGVSGSISGNHGHAAVIGATELSSGALSLDIQGAANHSHMVQLGSADLASIAAGQSVSVQSSTGDSNAHRHTVTFSRRSEGGGTGY
jgi:hypothetical protein